MSKLNKLNFKIEDLFRGCILSGIANAITIAFNPNATNIINDYRWNSVNYSIENNSNIYSTITFYDKYCVAIFRDKNSKRVLSNEFEDPKEYFKGALNIIQTIARELTLSDRFYLLGVKNIPKVTTAFWGYKNVIFSVDTYEDIMQNGGEIIRNQILPYEETLEIFKKEYGIEDKQINLLEEIYLRKMQNLEDIIVLTERERNMIDSSSYTKEEMFKIEYTFGKIGIYWE